MVKLALTGLLPLVYLHKFFIINHLSIGLNKWGMPKIGRFVEILS